MKSDDERALLDLIHRTAWTHDSGDFAELAKCYIEAASQTLKKGSEILAGPFNGRDAIIGWLSQVARDNPGIQARHVVTNTLIIEPGEQRTIACSYFMILVTSQKGVSVISAGTYRDVVVKRNGVWALASREAVMDSVAA